MCVPSFFADFFKGELCRFPAYVRRKHTYNSIIIVYIRRKVCNGHNPEK